MNVSGEKTGKYKILIVEDNLENAALMAEMLEVACGHSVVWTKNGHLALKEVSEQDFDVILMDIRMPEMSGFESSRQIRQLGYDMPIIAITSDATCLGNKELKNSGINSMVLKPFKFKQLEAAIEQAIGIN
ncbi:MAG TPA: response regulator [Candidatus Wallbacteria bacterium]|nr:response regulator [Candidatus Wallbacteria bacterium]